MTTETLSNTRIALTFGDSGNGMEGNLGDKGTGITTDELISLKDYFINLDYSVDYYSLNLDDLKNNNLNLDDLEYNAGVLVIRNYAKRECMENLFKEQISLDWDRKYWDTRRK